MSSINNLNQSSPLSPRPESYSATRRPAFATDRTIEQAAERTDRVELSPAARALASAPTPIREELVARIKAQIADGTYDIDARLDKTVTELAKDLNPLDSLYA